MIIYDVVLDATQEDCPLPTILTKNTLDTMLVGQILKLITSNEGTIRNIRTFTANNSCELLRELTTEEGFVFLIKKL
jgi:TusA-related sulfurtransferase